MSNPPEKFCLKWNDFQQNILSSFQDLRKQSDFSDVTLVCEDGYQVETHRIILTACSPFFSAVLSNKQMLSNKHYHPVIYMRGIKAEDLTAIVDFIYHGEASIFQEDLDGFLALDEELQLKGLAGSQNETDDDTKYSTPTNPYSNKKNISTKSSAKSTHISSKMSENYFYKDEIKVSLQANPVYDTSNTHESNVNHFDLVSADIGKVVVNANMEDLKGQINSMMEKINDGENKWKCSICGKASQNRQDVSRHVETHIEGMSYPYNQCGAVKRSSNALHVHISKYHKE